MRRPRRPERRAAALTSPTTGRTYPLRSLWQLDLPTYEPGAATCPRCADGDAAPRAGQQRHGRCERPARSASSGPGLFIAAGRPRGRWCVASAARRRRPSPTRDRRSVVGVDSAGPDRRPRVHASGPRDGRTVAFRIGVLENGAEFPPGHLVEHAATGVSGRRRRTGPENGELVAIRLDDAPGEPRRAGPAPVSGRRLSPASACSISAGVKISSNDALTIPSPSTAKTTARRAGPYASVAGPSGAGRWRRAPAGAGRRSSLSWYGSTLMNVTSGWAAAIGLTWSSVGPHCALCRTSAWRRRARTACGRRAPSATDVS